MIVTLTFRDKANTTYGQDARVNVSYLSCKKYCKKLTYEFEIRPNRAI